MTFIKAVTALRNVGCAHAEGDALRLMYAQLIQQAHGGKAEQYYAYLQASAPDETITEHAKRILADRAVAWDILMGVS